MYQYMDNILFASDNSPLLHDCLATLKVALASKGLSIATEKNPNRTSLEIPGFQIIKDNSHATASNPKN